MGEHEFNEVLNNLHDDERSYIIMVTQKYIIMILIRVHYFYHESNASIPIEIK